MSSESKRPNTQIDFSTFTETAPSSAKLDVPAVPSKSHWKSKALQSHDTKKLARKRPRSPEGDNVDMKTGMIELKLPKIVENGIRAYQSFRIQQKSPWESFRKTYRLQLGGTVTVAVREEPPSELVMIRAFAPTSEKSVYMIQRIHHLNVVTILEAFVTTDHFYAVLEHLPISLDHVVACPDYPSELQLTAILAQVGRVVFNLYVH